MSENGTKGKENCNEILSKVQNKNSKKKRKIHSELGPNFIAPDGGFGWLVCLAAGCSNLATFPILQQFGLLFRERLSLLNIPSSEITTMINMNQAATCLVGLANGPVFRRFTFRQVALFGSSIVFIAIIFTSFANSFIIFLMAFSILYGCGVGLTTSANSLALNTYFKEKRRIVTGFSWSFTALGPIIFPHIVTYLMPHYGVQGTVLLFAGLALNSIVCALLLQPVQWHTKKNRKITNENGIEEENLIDNVIVEIECKFCQLSKKKNRSLMSSQYLYNADDYLTTGYEIIDPGTPMLSRANDGWFSSSSAKRSLYGSKMSLTSRKMTNELDSKKDSTSNLRTTKEIYSEIKIDECPTEDCPSNKAPQDLKSCQNKSLVNSLRKTRTSPTTPTKSIPFYLKNVNENNELKDNKSNKSLIKNENGTTIRKRANTFNIEEEILNVACNKLEQYVTTTQELHAKCTCDEKRKTYQQDKEQKQKLSSNINDNNNNNNDDMQFSLWQKIVIFFDLNLLKDFSYINIMIGITIANFAELNFSVLTPFVLADMNMTKSQIATFMSLLGAADISVRFFVPFIAGKIGWENRTFFLVGVLGMAIGRIILAHFHSFYLTLFIALWIGCNKGLRTVFMVLCIPSHVPLDRLPSATGLHLLFSGIFYILSGPIIGFIRDHTNLTVTLHCLNITTYICAISWTLEKYIFKRRQRETSIIYG